MVPGARCYSVSGTKNPVPERVVFSWFSMWKAHVRSLLNHVSNVVLRAIDVVDIPDEKMVSACKPRAAR